LRKEVELKGARGRRGLQLRYAISREISGEECEEDFQRKRFIFNGQFIAFKEIRPSPHIDKLAEQVHLDECPIRRKQHDTTVIPNNTQSTFQNLSPPG
jgi:hypothetical protein